MRRGNEPQFMRAADGALVGIFLDADGCAEHEGGIEGLKSVLGIPSFKSGFPTRGYYSSGPEESDASTFDQRRALAGVEARRVRIADNMRHVVHWFAEGDARALIVKELSWVSSAKPRVLEDFSRELFLSKPDPIEHAGRVDCPECGAKGNAANVWRAEWCRTPAEKRREPHKARQEAAGPRVPKTSEVLGAAWSDCEFGIIVANEHEADLRALQDALLAGDALVFTGGGGVFKNAGLAVVIASRVPAESAEQLRLGDSDRIALEEAAVATGIAPRLAAAKKGYYALSPHWAKDLKSRFRYEGEGDAKTAVTSEVHTAYPVVFFLNPQDQAKYHSGWVTVEELDAWARGEGHIVKLQVAARA